MSDQALLGTILFASIVISVGGFLILGLMLRECQRLTRAVGTLIIQETAKLPGKSG